MKKIIVTIFVCGILFSFSRIETDVFICKGPSSKRYHLSKTCQGLKNCSTDIFKVTKAEATEMGRTLCGYED